MAHFINIECTNCHNKFRIEVSMYSNKKISFICQKCGNRISHFVPPIIDQLAAPPSEISTRKIKRTRPKVIKQATDFKAEGKSETEIQKSSPLTKIASIFKKKSDEVQPYKPVPAYERDKPPAVTERIPKLKEQVKSKNFYNSQADVLKAPLTLKTKQDVLNIPVQSPSLAQRDYKSKAGYNWKTKEIKAEREFSENSEATNQLREMKGGKSAASPKSVVPAGTAMVHIPKPGMPFIAQLSTPGFYKAGSAKRKDYSYIVSELSRFRTSVGVTGGKTSIPTKEAESHAAEAVKDTEVLSEMKEKEAPIGIQVDETEGKIPEIGEQGFSPQSIPPVQIDESFDINKKTQTDEEEALSLPLTKSEPEKDFKSELKPVPKIKYEENDEKIIISLDPSSISPFSQPSKPVQDIVTTPPMSATKTDSTDISPEFAEGKHVSDGAVSILSQPDVAVERNFEAAEKVPVPPAVPPWMKTPDQRAPAEYQAGIDEKATVRFPAYTGQQMQRPPYFGQQTQIPAESQIADQPSIPYASTVQQEGQGMGIEIPDAPNVPIGMQGPGQPQFETNTPQTVFSPQQSQFQPQPQTPSLPQTAPEMEQQVTEPPHPIPPPSVTSPTQPPVKRRAVTEDEGDEEKFGPSNFGLDF